MGLISEPPVLTTESWSGEALLQFIGETALDTVIPGTALKKPVTV